MPKETMRLGAFFFVYNAPSDLACPIDSIVIEKLFRHRVLCSLSLALCNFLPNDVEERKLRRLLHVAILSRLCEDERLKSVDDLFF